MNRALRLSLGMFSSGLVREESKVLMIVLELIKKKIEQENQKKILEN